MLKSILVALDGSSYSRAAIELGIRWARQYDALVVGLGIVDEPAIRRPELVPIGGTHYKEQADDLRVGRARRRVEQVLEQFALRCGEARVPSKVLEDTGTPSARILLEAQRYDLIILGHQTHFRFATQESPCETLTTILKNTPRPVVVASEKLPSDGPVIVAYDGSLQAARALQAFQASGVHQGHAVHIVVVNDDQVEAARHAERAAEFLRFHGIQSLVHPENSSASVAAELLNQIRRLQGSLLVMGAYGQPTLREFFLGSVTRTLLKESPVPLFLYH